MFFFTENNEIFVKTRLIGLCKSDFNYGNKK